MSLNSSSKYKNRKVETADGKFDSVKEYRRWVELKALERSGRISDLRRQVSYTLVASQATSSGRERPVKYIADFVYEKDGKTVVEDTKGVKTPEYVIKRKLMLYFYGIEIQEM